MQRKPALVAAAAVTLACGSGLVAAAAMTGSQILGFAHHHASAAPAPVSAPVAAHERVVTRTKNVYDTVVVPTTVAPTPATNAVSVGTYVNGAPPTQAPAPVDEAPPVTAAPVDPTTTTLPSVTTTTQPNHQHESDDDDGGSDHPPGDD
jgi:hypothetical protein